MRTNSGLFPFNAEIKKNVLKEYNTDEKRLQEDVLIIRNWLQTQKHLPEITCEPGIETLLLRCKMSIEKCKGCIDMYYTTRNLAPEFLRNNNPKLPHMQNVHNIFYSVPLPKLTSDNYRIIFCKFCDNNPEKFDPTCILRYIGNVAEIRFYEDFCVGDLVICDLEGAKLEHVLKITPLLIAKAFFVYEKVYCSRFKGIYFFNCPLMGDKLIMILKSLMKPKLANRIHVVRTTKDFLENFDIKLLPKDYGGSQPSLETLRGILQEKFIQYQDRFDLLDTLEVDESLRPEKLKNDELLGFHGNFRQLNVD